MTLAAEIASEDETMRERRCIVTGEVLSEAELVRFCVDPDGQVVPDVAATLPGRGMWVRAERASVDKAVAKNLFSKAAKASVRAGADLSDRTELLLARRMLADLGLARRSGALILGFDSVSRAFDTKVPPSVLVEASDAALDGRRKLQAAARAREIEVAVIDCLTCEELSVALGRGNVIHAALKPGRLAERLILDAGRLKGFRLATGSRSAGTGRNERDE